MTSNPPSGRQPSAKKAAPPPAALRQSARQQRIAHRQNTRALSSGTGGPSMIAIVSIVAIVAGVALIGLAWLWTQSGGQATGSPNPPGIVTPADVPQNGYTLGNPDAKVTFDLYSDYQCPNCQDFALETAPKLMADYIRPGKVKLVFHDLPVVDAIIGGTESRDAANAGMCARDQNKFWTMHDWLYSNYRSEKQGGSGAYTKARLIAIGRSAGLDMSKFEPCVNNGQHNAEVADEKSKAPSGVDGTPGIVVNGKVVKAAAGPNYVPTYDEMKAAIEAALGNAPASPSPSAAASASPSAAPTATPAATATPAPTPNAS